MKESLRLAQEAIATQAKAQADEQLILLNKPVLTNFDIDRMTADTFKKRIEKDPEFDAFINKTK
jgi:hypothetical protein